MLKSCINSIIPWHFLKENFQKNIINVCYVQDTLHRSNVKYFNNFGGIKASKMFLTDSGG